MAMLGTEDQNLPPKEKVIIITKDGRRAELYGEILSLQKRLMERLEFLGWDEARSLIDPVCVRHRNDLESLFRIAHDESNKFFQRFTKWRIYSIFQEDCAREDHARTDNRGAAKETGTRSPLRGKNTEDGHNAVSQKRRALDRAEHWRGHSDPV